MYSSVTLRTFVTTIYFKALSSPQKETLSPLNMKSQLLVPTILLSDPPDFLILGTSSKWTHIVFVLSCLPHSISNVFKAHPRCSVCQTSFLLRAEYFSIVSRDHILFI